MKPNIKTISEMTGFSQATVSNVLNNKKNVKQTTAEAIFLAAKQVGYLKTKRIENVRIVLYKKSGLVLTETPLINELILGVESEARQQNLKTMVFTLKEGEPEFEGMIEEIINARDSGIILLATELNWQDLKRFECIKERLVVVDAYFREASFDTILMDNMDSFYNSVCYLYQKGHRSFGFIDSVIGIRNFEYRKRGFLSALNDLNVTYDNAKTISLTPTLCGAYQDMLEYLKGKPELPTAFVAVNDIIAFGAMKAIKESGYSIPDDISIIGFDNMPFGDITSPGLTTVNILKKEMGEKAVQRLMQKIENDDQVPLVIQLQTSFVERSSVRNIL